MLAGMRYDRKVTDIIKGKNYRWIRIRMRVSPVANTPGVYHFILSVERPFDISCRDTRLDKIVGFIRISITGVCMP